MTDLHMPDVAPGKLLVATPHLLDPNFARTVVLVCQHGEEDGSLGLVLNQPTEATAAEFLPGWEPALSDPRRVFIGGPVQRETAVGLGRAVARSGGEGWMPIEAGLGLIDVGIDPADFHGELLDVRIFSGYAGWNAGQLEEEILRGDWFVVEAHPDDPFGRAPGDLWRRVLRRQPPPLVFYADFPLDPSLN